MRGSTDVNPSTSSLIAFKPRQVLLLEQCQRNLAVPRSMAKNRAEKLTQLKPEDESILTFSVALWLENNGFSKVLKRFLSAAQIQDDNWKAMALNLNEVFSKYQEICKGADEDIKNQKQQEEHVIGTTETNGNANSSEHEEKGKKKKKKSKGESIVLETGKTVEDTAKSENFNASHVNDDEDKNHKTADSVSDNVQKSKTSKKSNGDEVSELTLDQSTKKQKDKKKKRSKSVSQSLDDDEKQTSLVTESKQKDISSRGSVEAAKDEVDESKRASKKRKRIATDENENQSGQEVEIEESEPKKTKGLKEEKDVGSENISSEANGHTEQFDESTKGDLKSNGMEKSREPKSAKKQQNNSAEPKTVKAFQRVKIEEVKVDERLQDNSYWAKDGAEIGYGAKAQEVLGQVRGRDFRHEKTKKKRGSYRGGQIDLQSHSVKFNYSDEE